MVVQDRRNQLTVALRMTKMLMTTNPRGLVYSKKTLMLRKKKQRRKKKKKKRMRRKKKMMRKRMRTTSRRFTKAELRRTRRMIER